MRKIHLFFLTALTMVATVPQLAFACRRDVMAESRITESYDAVVVAIITSVEPRTQFLSAGLSPAAWTATAKLTGALDGKSETELFIINKPENLCEPSKIIALVGEPWVLYLRKSNEGWGVAASYPLSFARKIDKRFTGQP